MNLLTILPIIFSALALVISILVAWRNWHYIEINLRQSIQSHYMSFVQDINRQFISNPKLLSIYDHHPTGIKKSDDPEEKGRRLAMLYYQFNLFESVYVSYNHVLRLNKHGKAYWEPWTNCIKQLFEYSSEACAAFKEPDTQKVFSRDYVLFINLIIEEVEREKRNSRRNITKH